MVGRFGPQICQKDRYHIETYFFCRGIFASFETSIFRPRCKSQSNARLKQKKTFYSLVRCLGLVPCYEYWRPPSFLPGDVNNQKKWHFSLLAIDVGPVLFCLSTDPERFRNGSGSVPDRRRFRNGSGTKPKGIGPTSLASYDFSLLALFDQNYPFCSCFILI